MGSGKKEASRRERQGKTGDGMSNVRMKGENFYRDAKKVKKLNVLKEGRPQRNAAGDITLAASYQSREVPVARIEPNRKWFTNTRVIAQESLTQFREAIAKNANDPYSYLLKSNKLPMSLIRDDETKNGVKVHQAKVAVEQRPFKDTFGPKAQRKRVKLDISSIEDLAGHSVKMHDTFLEKEEQAALLSGAMGQETAGTGVLTSAIEPIFSKGQSKRIWNELYKVIDSSDVVIHVLDARDPDGTRCRSVEKYIAEEAPHKHLLFVLNKCDLVPTSVAAAWVRHLSKTHPTLAFHASLTNSFGKGTLISLLRQFSSLHASRKQISVGLIGYPNTGKSSIINTLRKKKVATVAPIPGETKVWQYVTLMKRIYLIDCPGVVPPKERDTPEDILLKGVVRVENVENPEQYVAAALAKCKKKHVLKTYEMNDYANHIDFLEQLARKGGRLLKGGEADVDGVAKMVLNDFLRGKLPWFTALDKTAAATGAITAEGTAELKAAAAAVEKTEDSKRKSVEGSRSGDVNRLNKMATAELRKRKRNLNDIDGETASAADVDADQNGEDDGSDAESFDSFSDDSDSEVGDDGDVEGVSLSLALDEDDEEEEGEKSTV